MEDKIAQLMERYGEHNYEILTEQQRELLLHPEICNNIDMCGLKTVRLRSISKGEDGIHLHLWDVYNYMSREQFPFGYISKRNKVLGEVLGVSEDLKKNDEGEYIFELPDSSTVAVMYELIKDRP